MRGVLFTVYHRPKAHISHHRGGGFPIHIAIASAPLISAPVSNTIIPSRPIMPILRGTPYCACRSALRMSLPPRGFGNSPLPAILGGCILPLFLERQIDMDFPSAAIRRVDFGDGRPGDFRRLTTPYVKDLRHHLARRALHKRHVPPALTDRGQAVAFLPPIRGGVISSGAIRAIGRLQLVLF